MKSKIGDNVSIQTVENGFVVTVNEYAMESRRQRMVMVATNAFELMCILKDIFAEDSE